MVSKKIFHPFVTKPNTYELYLLKKKTLLSLTPTCMSQLCFHFGKEIIFFFKNPKCVEQQTRAVDQTCTCTWIIGNSIDLWL